MTIGNRYRSTAMGKPWGIPFYSCSFVVAPPLGAERGADLGLDARGAFCFRFKNSCATPVNCLGGGH
jgi:hypothetical protein